MLDDAHGLLAVGAGRVWRLKAVPSDPQWWLAEVPPLPSDSVAVDDGDVVDAYVGQVLATLDVEELHVLWQHVVDPERRVVSPLQRSVARMRSCEVWMCALSWMDLLEPTPCARRGLLAISTLRNGRGQ